MTQVVAPRWGRDEIGAVADGGFKLLLAVVYVAAAGPLARSLGVPVWMMAVSGAALLIGGCVEIAYVRRCPMRTFKRLMFAYDGGWTLAALIGLLLAWQGGGAGGEIWIGYQVVAPLVLGALLVRGS